MSRRLRSFKRWCEVYGRILAIIVLIVGVVAGGVWYALSTHEPPAQEDFGNSITSEVARKISNLTFEEGQALLDEGDFEGGRAVMQRLAPLSNASLIAKGNPLAHLWMAKLFLGDAQQGILNRYPIELTGGKNYAPRYSEEMRSEVVERGIKHLESALILNPKLDEARKILSEWLLLSGKRNEAYEILFEGVRITDAPSVDILVPMIHATVYQGNDLELEEWNWHEFATLGRGITGPLRGDKASRLCYIFLANVLGEFNLAKSASQKYISDFDASVDRMQGLAEYIKAVYLLKAETFDEVKALESLVAACAFDPESAYYAEGLSRLYETYPELKADIQSGISPLLKRNHSVSMDIFYAELLASDVAVELLMDVRAQGGASPELLVALVKHSDGDGRIVNLSQMMQWADYLVNDRSLSTQQKFQVLVARGRLQMQLKQWQHAVESFEQALAISQVTSPPSLHRYLSACYAELGNYLMEDQHKLMVRK
ncbi:hypothetical protein [Rubritalea marina]|uniref:hypothetical protein n=1 Tax=Rubritalea marina TaxID=361055 RepID=UPI001969B684|nr:hypothetical protein [Rubritalea marina]